MSIYSCYNARISGSKFYRSITEDKIRQSTRNCLHRPIHKAVEGRTYHNSNINECSDGTRSNCVILLGITTHVLLDIRLQFDPKSIAALTMHLGIRHLTTTVNHPQTNGQVNWFKRIIVERLSRSVGKHRTDWEQYLQLVTYA